MKRASDQGLAAVALAKQTQERLESIRKSQEAIADAQRRIEAAQRAGGE